MGTSNLNRWFGWSTHGCCWFLDFRRKIMFYTQVKLLFWDYNLFCNHYFNKSIHKLKGSSFYIIPKQKKFQIWGLYCVHYLSTGFTMDFEMSSYYSRRRKFVKRYFRQISPRCCKLFLLFWNISRWNMTNKG